MDSGSESEGDDVLDAESGVACNLCGVFSEHGFGTRRWNDSDIPLKRCAPCRKYFTEWRKQPGSKAAASEKKHESKESRQASKSRNSKAYVRSEHGRYMRSKQPSASVHAQRKRQRQWSKTDAGIAKNKRELKKRYKRIKDSPDLWFVEAVRLAFLGSIRGSRKGSSLRNSTEFKDSGDVKRHFTSLFTQGMTMQNFGKGKDKWSIGHDIPKCYYDKNDHEDFARAWSKANVFPQWWSENAKQNCSLPPFEHMVRLKSSGALPRIFGGEIPCGDRKIELERKARAGRLFV